jgi:putative transposase
VKYMVIKEQKNIGSSLTMSQKASLLTIDRSGYYKWVQKKSPDANKVHNDIKIRDEIQDIALEFPRYGYRRMTV